MSDNLATYLSVYGALVSVVRPVIIVAILWALWVALQRARLGAGVRVGTWLAVAVPLGVWLAVIWILAVDGVFLPRPGGVSPLPIAIIVPFVVGLFALTRSQTIAAAIDTVSPSWLIGLQLYRIIGGNFVVLWSFGAVPAAFALPAGIGDMIVGLLALPAALYVASGAPGGRSVAIAWNLLGIADLISAVTLGILTSPGPQQLLALDHPNILVGSYPTVMTPAFAVPLSLILHGVSLWQLRRRARQPSLVTAAAQ